ncbi:unnamed protein product [Urochloa humidicola]
MDPLPPPALMEELVEEVLIRIPPDDPASLVRAALVCKRWCRLISGASFRRRFRELHPAAPMLGFLYERYSGVDFVPASSFRPPHAFRDNWRMLDSRHGRVLVMDWESSSFTEMEFIVWDPVTDSLQKLPILKFRPVAWSAALLCATAGCDHLDCRRGAFIAVVVVTDDMHGARHTSSYAYSSEQDSWSEPIAVQHHNDCILRLHRALVGNALYFNYELNTKILEYDLGRRELSIINLPLEFCGWHIVLMEAEDGRLGFATIKESKLSVWSRESGMDGYAGWAQQRVIELDKLQPVLDCNLPVQPDVFAIAHPPYVVAVADSVNVIFVWTDDGLFTIDLKSSQFKRIGEFISNFGVVPYTSFCTPALSVASTGDERPRADASSA